MSANVLRAVAFTVLCLTIIISNIASTKAQQSSKQNLERDGLKLKLAPLAPDAVRAFFMARGFTRNDADFLVKTGCVFRSAIGSSYAQPGGPTVTVNLHEWQLNTHEKTVTSPKLREDWNSIWETRQVSEDARVAFYWSLFPSRQTFAAKDYNWGMLTFGLPPGTRFSLILKWRSGGTRHTTTLKDLTCAQ